jgi:hypothetical protein
LVQSTLVGWRAFEEETLGQENRCNVVGVPGRYAAGKEALPPVPDHIGKTFDFRASICGGETKTPGLQQQVVDARRAALVANAQGQVAPRQADQRGGDQIVGGR